MDIHFLWVHNSTQAWAYLQWAAAQFWPFAFTQSHRQTNSILSHLIDPRKQSCLLSCNQILANSFHLRELPLRQTKEVHSFGACTPFHSYSWVRTICSRIWTWDTSINWQTRHCLVCFQHQQRQLFSDELQNRRKGRSNKGRRSTESWFQVEASISIQDKLNQGQLKWSS